MLLTETRRQILIISYSPTFNRTKSDKQSRIWLRDGHTSIRLRVFQVFSCYIPNIVIIIWSVMRLTINYDKCLRGSLFMTVTIMTCFWYQTYFWWWHQNIIHLQNIFIVEFSFHVCKKWPFCTHFVQGNVNKQTNKQTNNFKSICICKCMMYAYYVCVCARVPHVCGCGVWCTRECGYLRAYKPCKLMSFISIYIIWTPYPTLPRANKSDASSAREPPHLNFTDLTFYIFN